MHTTGWLTACGISQPRLTSLLMFGSLSGCSLVPARYSGSLLHPSYSCQFSVPARKSWLLVPAGEGCRVPVPALGKQSLPLVCVTLWAENISYCHWRFKDFAVTVQPSGGASQTSKLFPVPVIGRLQMAPVVSQLMARPVNWRSPRSLLSFRCSWPLRGVPPGVTSRPVPVNIVPGKPWAFMNLHQKGGTQKRPFSPATINKESI